MKIRMNLLFLACAVTAGAGPLDKAWIRGTTDKDPLTYKPGEVMAITLTPMAVEGELPVGEYFLDWKRTDDFGGLETGRVALTTAPFVYRAKLDKPGFVRLQSWVVDRNGKRLKPFFDGGAGVEPEKLATKPEPADFDAFWARQFARLDRVPMKSDRIALPCANTNADLFAVRIDCAGLRPVTGYLTVPKDVAEGKTYPARLETHGYSAERCVHAEPKRVRENEIVLNINAHGLKLPAFGATDADTKALRFEIRAGAPYYAFDEKQNADPETAYFNGMVLRVKRALQYLKTVKGWNGRDLIASGGSQGGLQTIWAAGCGEGVTRAESGITWCCDMSMNNIRRARKISSDGWYVPWTESMGYYDAANFAKRIPPACRTVITRAGIGDYCCPPMGLAKLYNNIPGNKEIHWMQGSQHGYVPPAYAGRDFVRATAACRATASGRHGVLLLTFDDALFHNWDKALSLFDRYGAHATFFVDGRGDVWTALTKMREYQARGHSVGFHSAGHVPAKPIIAQKGIGAWLKSQIEPQVVAAKKANLAVRNFAYPNSSRTDETDAALKPYFNRLRTGHLFNRDPAKCPLATCDEAFVSREKLVSSHLLWGMGFSSEFPGIAEDLEKGLERLAARNEALVLYSHDIKEKPDGDCHNTSLDVLERILAKAHALGIEVIGFDEIGSFADAGGDPIP